MSKNKKIFHLCELKIKSLIEVLMHVLNVLDAWSINIVFVLKI